MNAPFSFKPSHSNAQNADEISSPPPSTSFPSVSMLNNAKNTLISNSSLNINTTNNAFNVSPAASPLDLLHKCVAPNAILNSGGRADEVRCHPGTREEVINMVESSIAQEHSGPRMLWLSGPAGAGKSAIMQTVAERCKERGIPQAKFFFFRGDSSRRDARPLVATLMHQIIKLYPSIGAAVAPVLVSEPLLFQSGLQKQFDTLMYDVFPAIQHSLCTSRPLVLFIDGLDECDSENKTAQRQLLQALDTLLVEKGPYFRVVVASRVEPQISMAFKRLHSRVDSVFLDEQYSPEKDIRLFVTAEFDKIKSTHFLAYTLDQNWPSDADVDKIVAKSSGQFIYASTVMRFITYSPASPVLSLQKVQGIAPAVKNTPFAHLDSIYSYIMEQVDDLEAVKCIFAFKFLQVEDVHGIMDLMHFYQTRYSRAVFNSCVSELTPIVYQRDRRLVFFHASFQDFLLDNSRARQYHIDLNEFCAAVFPVLWVSNPLGWGSSVYEFTVEALKHVQKPTPEITAALMNAHPWTMPLGESDIRVHFSGTGKLITHLHGLYDLNDPQSLTEIIHKWMAADPRLASILSRHIPQSATFKTKATSRNKRAKKFVKNCLRRLTGRGE